MTEQQHSPASSESLALSDGLLRFSVRPLGGGEPTDHAIDVLVLKLACEECEAVHRLEERDGNLVTTAAFLHDLAGRLNDLGVQGCSPSVAFQLWVAAAEQIGRLKKNTSETPN